MGQGFGSGSGQAAKPNGGTFVGVLEKF